MSPEPMRPEPMGPEGGAGETNLPADELERVRGQLLRALPDLVAAEGVLRGCGRPVIVAELLLGPRADVGGDAGRLRLQVVDLLEVAMRPGSLYLRMAALAGEEAQAVLALAVQRHAAAPWVVTLSGRIEGAWRGRTALRAAALKGDLFAACLAWYAAGGRAAVIEVASRPPRLEGFCALGQAEDREALLDAAALALTEEPTAPIPAWLAAIWGPELEGLLSDLLDRLQSPRGRAALSPWLRPWPELLDRARA
jgi:hypothetical protein